jgi:hypothetical protein
MELHRVKHGIRNFVPEANDELVGMEGLDVELATI